jgi:hypothetical protein
MNWLVRFEYNFKYKLDIDVKIVGFIVLTIDLDMRYANIAFYLLVAHIARAQTWFPANPQNVNVHETCMLNHIMLHKL